LNVGLTVGGLEKKKGGGQLQCVVGGTELMMRGGTFLFRPNRGVRLYWDVIASRAARTKKNESLGERAKKGGVAVGRNREAFKTKKKEVLGQGTSQTPRAEVTE